jgi:hypothetical protein
MGARATKAISRLLNQFTDGPNWLALLTAFMARPEDTDIVLEGLLLERTIDTAEGVWLDQVGDIVGYPRPAEEVGDSGIFTLKAVGDADNSAQGLSSLGALDGGVLTSLVGLPTGNTASDTVYRQYLYGKVRATYSGSGYADVFTFIDFVFGTGTCSAVTSDDVGVVKIELATSLSGAERRIVEQLAPRSAGVELYIANWP